MWWCGYAEWCSDCFYLFSSIRERNKKVRKEKRTVVGVRFQRQRDWKGRRRWWRMEYLKLKSWKSAVICNDKVWSRPWSHLSWGRVNGTRKNLRDNSIKMTISLDIENSWNCDRCSVRGRNINPGDKLSKKKRRSSPGVAEWFQQGANNYYCIMCLSFIVKLTYPLQISQTMVFLIIHLWLLSGSWALRIFHNRGIDRTYSYYYNCG